MKRMMVLSVMGALFISTVCLSAAEQAGSAEPQKAFRENQKQEREAFLQKMGKDNDAFRKSLKEMAPDGRAAAVKEHRQTQYQERAAFSTKQHEESLVSLKARLASDKKMSSADKDALINFFQSQYKERVAFNEAQHRENIAFFESTAQDTSLTGAEKKKAMESHLAKQRADMVAFIEQQKEKTKAERDHIKTGMVLRKEPSRLAVPKSAALSPSDMAAEEIK